MEDYRLYAYDSNGFYYKGFLDNLEIRNDGRNNFIKETPFNLYLEDGTFYKKEYKKEYKDNVKSDVSVSKYDIQYSIIQIDYKLYYIPVKERLSIYEGRKKLRQMLLRYGIKGLTTETYNKPLEYCFNGEYRVDTKSFINFDYDEYIKEIKSFIEKYPLWEREIKDLKNKNIEVICKFYNIEINELPKLKANRLKYAIRALNNKINNKIKDKW